MGVEAGALTRCSMIYYLNGVTMQTQFHWRAAEALTDANWRERCRHSSERVWRRVRGYVTDQLQFAQVVSRIMNFPAYPAYVVSTSAGNVGLRNTAPLHQGAYAQVNIIGEPLAGEKPLRNGFKIMGGVREQALKGQWNRTWLETLGARLLEEFLAQFGAEDPYPELTYSDLVCVGKTAGGLYFHQQPQNLWLSGPVKTLGSRFYPN